MSRLLILVTLVLTTLGMVDRAAPLWAGPTHESAATGRTILIRAPAPTGYGWPLAGAPTVTRAFTPPPEPWLPGHRGVDLAGTPGERVLAAGQGQVSFAGTVAGLGVVSVDHPGGLRTTYEPVTPKVHRGQPVLRGDVLGILLDGHPGCPAAACLHWGLRSGAVYLDPLSLLHRATIRLLPLDGVVED